MALAGITAVGEFHYLHHGPDGAPYADPNAMGERADRGRRRGRHPHHAARHLLPARRHRRRARRRCSAASPTATPTPGRERVGGARRTGRRRASAPRSTACGPSTPRRRRPSPRGRRERVAAAARPRLRAAGRERGLHGRLRRARPTALLADGRRARRALHRRARHPPRPTPTSTLLGGDRAGCCLCPTTERDLGRRHRRRPRALAEAGARLSLGTRLARRRSTCSRRRAPSSSTSAWPPATRGRHRAADLLRAATADGHASLGWPDAGRIAPGALADLVTVGLDSVRLAGTPAEARRRRRSCSRRPPPTCATSSSAAGSSSATAPTSTLDVAAELRAAMARGAHEPRSSSTTSACSSPTTRRGRGPARARARRRARHRRRPRRGGRARRRRAPTSGSTSGAAA